jgi:hypothetical protein
VNVLEHTEAPMIAKKTIAKANYLFLFVGRGFRTSYKSLECFAWFVRSPSEGERKRIERKLPLPVRLFTGWDDDVLTFASDDLLETYVEAAYDPKYAKMPFRKARDALGERLAATSQWDAFCSDFERAMNDIHAKNKLRLVLKNDLDGESKTGPWHRSVKESYQVAELALKEGRRFMASS